MMKESVYKSYDELPLFLNAATVAHVLGVSPNTGYELMHEEGFLCSELAAGWWRPRSSSSGGRRNTREVRGKEMAAAGPAAAAKSCDPAKERVLSGPERERAGGVLLPADLREL